MRPNEQSKAQSALGVLDGVLRRALPGIAQQRLSDSDRRVARQTFWTGGVAGVEFLVGLVQVAIAARVLGPEGYGEFAIIVAASSLVYGFVCIPGGHTVITFASRSVAEGLYGQAANVLRFAMATSLGMSLLAYGLIVVLALAAGSWLGIQEAHAEAFLLYSIVGVVFSVRTETLAVLRLSDRMSYALIASAIGGLARIVVLVAVFRADGGLVGIIFAYLVGSVVEAMGLLVAAGVSASDAGLKDLLRSWSIRVPSELLRFHASMYGTAIIGTMNGHLDPLLVAQFTTASNVGLYRAARQIADMTRRPFRLLAGAVQPEFSRRWFAGDGAAVRRTATRFTIVSLALAAIAFGMLAVFCEPIVRLVLGDEFSEVAPIVVILILGSFLGSVSAPLSVLAVATGRAWGSLAPVVAGLAAAVLAYVWLVPRFGVEGAAWARNIHYLVAIPVSLAFAMSVLRRSWRL